MIHMITVILISCIVSVLTEGYNKFVPRRDKQFYKFWWSEELTLLKGTACDADKVWKGPGKRRSIPIFTARSSYASAVLGIEILSVYLSVRPSVRLSHACIVTK